MRPRAAGAGAVVATVALLGLAPAPPGAGGSVVHPLPRPDSASGPVEDTLPNGLRLRVLPMEGTSWVAAEMLLPGGGRVDPPGREGLAGLTARLLTRGAGSRSGRRLVRHLESLGVRLSASATSDAVIVSAAGVADQAPRLLDLLADAVVRPTFPGAEVEAFREEMQQRLVAELERPAVRADRAFLRTVYRGHPYGRLPTPASLARLDRPAVVEHHRRWYRPEGTLLVVAGDVAPARVRRWAREAFGGWKGRAPAREEAVGLAGPSGPRIVLVHEPGTPGAVVRVGQAVVRGSSPRWPPLHVARHVLGEGAAGRLRPLGASARAVRRRGPGFVQLGARTRATSAGAMVQALLEELRRLREETVSPGELRVARGALTGALLRESETPGQVASRLVLRRLLGLPHAPVAREMEDLERVGLQEVREAVTDALAPQRMTVVVVADAARVRGQLATLGPVEVVDAEGRPVDGAPPTPAGSAPPLDAALLEPVTLEYRISAGGREVGRLTRTLSRASGGPSGEETMVSRAEARIGERRMSQSVTFTVPGFAARVATSEVRGPEGERETRFEVRDGRLVAVRESGGPLLPGVQLPPGSLVGDMVELAVWVAALEEGGRFTAPVVRGATGEVERVTFTVAGREEVAVPAGTFHAWRVEVGGSEPQTIWARVDPPHLPVRIEPAAPGVVLELASAAPVR